MTHSPRLDVSSPSTSRICLDQVGGGCIGVPSLYGFTILELMVAVAIVGILAAVGTPSLISVIATQRVKSATFDMYATLNIARSEAIKRNTVVTIAPRGGDFANGYDVQAGGVVLKSQPALTAVNIAATPVGVSLAFDSYGRLATPVRYLLLLSATTDATVTKRCLLVSISGRASIRADADHDGDCING
jgi:type IV fimbrial biogenesis protein FimT